jgi:hypothetical protein
MIIDKPSQKIKSFNKLINSELSIWILNLCTEKVFSILKSHIIRQRKEFSTIAITFSYPIHKTTNYLQKNTESQIYYEDLIFFELNGRIKKI